MCDSPESRGKMGLSTDLVQTVTKPVICFHSQSGSGSSLLLVGSGDGSSVERSWRRFLRRCRPST